MSISVSGHSYPPMNVISLPDYRPDRSRQIDNDLNAAGRKEVGKTATSSTVSRISDLLYPRDTVSSTVPDERSDINQYVITDSRTGSRIISSPPNAVLDIVGRAKMASLGRFLDKRA